MIYQGSMIYMKYVGHHWHITPMKPLNFLKKSVEASPQFEKLVKLHWACQSLHQSEKQASV
jgi:hypothetical protein